MAEIDLLCEDIDQANVKLLGAKYVLKDVLGVTENKGRQPNAKVKGDAFGASPATVRHAFSMPPFLLHSSTCDCIMCSNLPLYFVVVEYVNLTGIWFHETEDFHQAGSCFEGTRSAIAKMRKKLQCPGLSQSMVQKGYNIISNLLFWQVECMGRQKQFTECKAVLLEAYQILLEMPVFLQQQPLMKSRFYHQSEFVQEEWRRTGEGDGLTASLNKLSVTDVETLSSLSPNYRETVSNFQTPSVRHKPSDPKKPVKRVIPRRNK